jgi:hypothetical protein
MGLGRGAEGPGRPPLTRCGVGEFVCFSQRAEGLVTSRRRACVGPFARAEWRTSLYPFPPPLPSSFPQVFGVLNSLGAIAFAYNFS